MVKPLLMGAALILLMAFVVACGEAATAVPPTATTAPTAEPPTAAPTPTEATMEEEDEGDTMVDVDPALKAVADDLAGGPGAVYVGDLSQLVGPPPGLSEVEDEETGELRLDDPLGDGTGNVPLEYLEKNIHIFETDYYRSLLDKAKLTDPKRRRIQHPVRLHQPLAVALQAANCLLRRERPEAHQRTGGLRGFQLPGAGTGRF